MFTIKLTLVGATAVLLFNWLDFLFCLYRKSNFRGRRLLTETLAGFLLLGTFLMLPGLLLPEHSPLTSRAEIFGLYSWSILCVYLVLTRFNSLKSMGSLVLPITLIFLGLSLYQLSARSFMGGSSTTPAPPFWIHIFFIVLAYGSFTVSFLMAVGYLRSEHQLRAKSVDGFFFMLPSLEDLDGALQQSIWIGVTSLIAGILLAFFTSGLQGTLGSFFFLDPNVLGSIFTGIIYGTILFIRRRALFTNRRIAYLAISGFVFIGLLFLSMNFLTRMHQFL